MNLQEVTNALGLAQAFDNRTVGEGNVRAWHAVLSKLDGADVMEAIRRHYRTESAWIMPAHVVRIVGEIDRERAKAARQWAPGQYGIPKDEALPEIERVVRLTADDVSPAVLDLLSQLRAELPDVDRSKLFPRQAYWEQQQRTFARPDAAANPLYRFTATADAKRILDEAERDETIRLEGLETALAECRTNGPHDSGIHIVTCPVAVHCHCKGLDLPHAPGLRGCVQGPA